jgi:hypothetical protein
MKQTLQYCKCKNVSGYYRTNNVEIEVDVMKGDWSTLRIVGISNDILVNEYLPPYHGKSNVDGANLFEQWGSAIIVVPPYIPNDVFKRYPDRFPDVIFNTERT